MFKFRGLLVLLVYAVLGLIAVALGEHRLLLLRMIFVNIGGGFWLKP